MTRAPRRCLGALALLLSACAADDEPRLRTRSEPGAPTGDFDDPACSDVECAALAGICQEARCDGLTGCRVSAAHEGEPCLAGNPCGAAECRSGDCVALAPPACAELSDACFSGVCRPEVGCVAELRALPGAAANPVRLPSMGAGRVTASNACQEQPPVSVACTAEGLTGPSAYFELDLSEATKLTQVHLVVDASFAFEAALVRGRGSDPALLSCGGLFYSDSKSGRLSAELEPGRYNLVVTGRSAADRGPISVASAVEDPGGTAPTNDDCATPLALDGAIEQQSIIPNLTAATPQVTVRCAPLGARDVFYELDLSGRSSAVMLDVEVGELDGGNLSSASLLATGSGTCGEVLTCGKTWSRRVSPGIYQLALHIDAEDVEDTFSVRVRATEMSCPTTLNDRLETAIDLDPTLITQRLQGNTACGNDDSSVCSEDQGAPDLFYRLDLRGHGAPQLVSLGGEHGSLLNYVLVQSGETDALRPTPCKEAGTYFILAPRLYYLVFDGIAQGAGRFDLELHLQDEFTAPRDCLTHPGPFAFGTCLQDSEPACTVSMAHPDCIQTAVECGLASDVYVSFCTAQPGCCDGTAPIESCEGPWEAAGFCPR